MSSQEISRCLPAALAVAFPRTTDGVADGTLTVYSVSTAGLALPELAGASGFGGTKVLRSSAVAAWASGGTAPQNDAELLALARAMAADWCLWQLGMAGAAYYGAQPWTPEGHSDLEWSHDGGALTLAALRGPWLEPGAGAGGGPGGGGDVYFSYGTYGSLSLFFTLNFGNEIVVVNGIFVVNGGDVTFSTTNLNFYGGDTLNFHDDVYLKVARNRTTYVDGPGYLYLDAATEVCGDLFWCCASYVLPSPGPAHDVRLPAGPAATGPVTGVTDQGTSALTGRRSMLVTVPGWTYQPKAGDRVTVEGVQGSTWANGTWQVRASTPTTAQLAIDKGVPADAGGSFAASPDSDIYLPSKVVYNLSAGADTTLDGVVPQPFGEPVNAGDVTGASNASPVVLTVPGWAVQPAVGQVVVVSGVLGNTAANGTFGVTASTATTVTLSGSSGSGAFAASPGSTIQLAGPGLVVLRNAGLHNITITDASASGSQAWNQIALPPAWSAAGLALAPGDAAALWWDACDSGRWAVLWATAAAPGGGASDHKLLVRGDDTAADYLAAKTSPGPGISLAVTSPGGSETLLISTQNVPVWAKCTVAVSGTNLRVTHPDGTFTDTALPASASLTVTLFSAAAASVVHGVKVKPNTSFAGGSVTTCTMTVGNAAQGAAAHSGSPGANVRQAPGDTVGYVLVGHPGGTALSAVMSQSGTQAVTATVTAGGANLNALTAGSAEVDVCVSTTP